MATRRLHFSRKPAALSVLQPPDCQSLAEFGSGSYRLLRDSKSDTDDPDAFQLESLDPSPLEWPQAPAGIEDQPNWQAPELKLDDERIMVLDRNEASYGTRNG